MPLKKYVFSVLDDYCLIYNNIDKKLFEDIFGKKQYFQTFINIVKQGPYTNSIYAKYIKTGDAKLLGICINEDDIVQKRKIKHFVERFVWPELTAYYTNKYLRNNEYQTRTTSKVLATRAIACLLGIEDMIPYCEYITIKILGKKNKMLFGNFMEEAKGICGMDISIEDRKKMLTPEFQRRMMYMNILDVICHEQDHSPNNYNVIIEEGKLVSLSIFDNNGVGTFSLNGNIDYETYKKCSSYLKEDGTINRPYIDKYIMERIERITKKDIKIALKPHLGMVAINCTWKRIVKLKKAIKATSQKRPGFIIDSQDFSNETLNEELSGKYGKTYLVSFLQDCSYRSSYEKIE